jgi:hypothetical protein
MTGASAPGSSSSLGLVQPGLLRSRKMRPNFSFIVCICDDLNSRIGALGRHPDVKTHVSVDRTQMPRILIIILTIFAGICAAGAQESGRNESFSKRGPAYPLRSQRGTAFPTAPVLHDGPPTQAAPALGPKPPPVLSPENTVPLSASALPDCPKWDWSRGAPPPLRRPFDRSKLYCPPQPFNPPNPSIGCVCNQQ